MTDVAKKPGLVAYNWGAVTFAVGMFFYGASSWTFISQPLSIIFHVAGLLTFGLCFLLMTSAYVKALRVLESKPQ